MDNKKNNKSAYDNYENLTKFIYQELSWLPLYIKKDGKVKKSKFLSLKKKIEYKLSQIEL